MATVKRSPTFACAMKQRAVAQQAIGRSLFLALREIKNPTGLRCQADIPLMRSIPE